MAVHIQWDSEEKNAIVWTLIGRWTWDEYAAGWKTMLTLLGEVEEHLPDFIFDVRRMTMLPPDVITRLKLDYLKVPPKVGRMIAVGVDTHLQFFWNTFTDMPYARHLKMRYFDTLEAALEFSRTGEDRTS
ncbi:MAG: hypothetical protein ABI835_17360 [Chloroflexota bacterium]